MGLGSIAGGGAKLYGFGKQNSETLQTRQLDPRYKQMVDESNKMAQNYRTNLPDIQSQRANIIADQGRSGLAQNIAGADIMSNRRGMLYGGRAAGARANVESTAAADVAEKIRAANLEEQSNLEGIEGQALESGMNYRNQIQGLNDDAYNEALSRRQGRLDQQGGIFRGIGKGIGGLLGGRK